MKKHIIEEINRMLEIMNVEKRIISEAVNGVGFLAELLGKAFDYVAEKLGMEGVESIEAKLESKAEALFGKKTEQLAEVELEQVLKSAEFAVLRTAWAEALVKQQKNLLDNIFLKSAKLANKSMTNASLKLGQEGNKKAAEELIRSGFSPAIIPDIFNAYKNTGGIKAIPNYFERWAEVTGQKTADDAGKAVENDPTKPLDFSTLEPSSEPKPEPNLEPNPEPIVIQSDTPQPIEINLEPVEHTEKVLNPDEAAKEAEEALQKAREEATKTFNEFYEASMNNLKRYKRFKYFLKNKKFLPLFQKSMVEARQEMIDIIAKGGNGADILAAMESKIEAAIQEIEKTAPEVAKKARSTWSKFKEAYGRMWKPHFTQTVDPVTGNVVYDLTWYGAKTGLNWAGALTGHFVCLFTIFGAINVYSKFHNNMIEGKMLASGLSNAFFSQTWNIFVQTVEDFWHSLFGAGKITRSELVKQEKPPAPTPANDGLFDNNVQGFKAWAATQKIDATNAVGNSDGTYAQSDAANKLGLTYKFVPKSEDKKRGTFE